MTAKERIGQALEELPDDATMEEAMVHLLAFKKGEGGRRQTGSETPLSHSSAQEATADQERSVALSLATDEALVLFDWLSRANAAAHPGFVSDRAFQQVLYNLECLLEKNLVEPFNERYEQRVTEAKARIVGPQ